MTVSTAAGMEERMRRHALLESSDLDEVRASVAGVLNEHRLAARSSAISARVYAKGRGPLKVCMLEYGEAVTVETQPAADFVLVQCALRGQVDVRCAEGNWTIHPGHSLVLPSSVPLTLDWEHSALHVLVKIPLARLNGVYETLVGRPPSSPLRFRHEFGGDDVAAGWASLVNYYCDQLERASPESTASLMGTRVAEEALMGHLLCTSSAALDEPMGRNIAPRLVRRAREFIEVRLGDPITLTDIAVAAGTSARSLSRAYQEYYGISPMASVRQLRLERIHAALKESTSDDSVSDIAIRWGCLHLGRFATAYRERFGQSPHETLKRAR